MPIGYKDAITKKRWIADEIDPEEEFLCVTHRDGGYRIYNAATGRPFLKHIKFLEKNVAIQFGKLLHKWYGEYLWILTDDDWKEKDIPSLVQYTIPNGVEILSAIEELKQYETITNIDLFNRFI